MWRPAAPELCELKFGTASKQKRTMRRLWAQKLDKILGQLQSPPLHRQMWGLEDFGKKALWRICKSAYLVKRGTNDDICANLKIKRCNERYGEQNPVEGRSIAHGVAEAANRVRGNHSDTRPHDSWVVAFVHEIPIKEKVTDSERN